MGTCLCCQAADTDTALESAHNQEDRGARGSDLRALSVEFLCTKFLDELEVGEDDKVFSIEPRIRAAGEAVVCPRDGRPGAAYVDVADDPNAGVANFMLSYTWGYKVREMVKALESYCRRTEQCPADVRVWICCLCVNQHRVKERADAGQKVSFEEFERVFRTKVQAIGHVLALITPWDKPLYVTRLWCIFELVTARRNNVKLTIVLPEDQEQAIADALMARPSWRDIRRSGETLASAEGGGSGLRRQASAEMGIGNLSNIFQALGGIKVESAEASYLDDKRNILRAVAPGIDLEDKVALAAACVDYNQEVVRELQRWFAETMEQNVRLKLADGAPTSKIQHVCGQLALFCNTLGDSSRGERLIQDTIRASEASGVTSTTEYCMLLRTLGTIYRFSIKQDPEKFQRALDVYLRAKEQLEALELDSTKEYADLICVISILYGMKGLLDESLAWAERAKTSFERANATKTPDFGNLYKSMGRSLHAQGKVAAAMEHYEMARRVFEEIGATTNVWFLDLLVQMGKVKVGEKKAEEATLDLLRAKAEYENLGLTDSIQYKDAMQAIRELQLCQMPA